MGIKRRIKVSKKDEGLRLDVFLSKRLENLSRSWIQKIIKTGEVKINSKKASASSKVGLGDLVSGSFAPPKDISLEPDILPSYKIKIVYEDDDFIVIDKPAGLVVHPSHSTPSGTLANWLIYKYPQIKDVTDPKADSELSKLRPGIVHRLDKDTSGLMVIAKNKKTFNWLKKQFKGRHVKKKYLVLVFGGMQGEKGEIEFPIARSKTDPTKQVAIRDVKVKDANAKSAITSWRLLKKFPDFSYIEASPASGRMHQIRVHMRAIGHPVTGDPKYGSKSKTPKHLGRMFLHASSLKFLGPHKEQFTFTSPLPSELDKCLQNLPYMI